MQVRVRLCSFILVVGKQEYNPDRSQNEYYGSAGYVFHRDDSSLQCCPAFDSHSCKLLRFVCPFA